MYTVATSVKCQADQCLYSTVREQLYNLVRCSLVRYSWVRINTPITQWSTSPTVYQITLNLEVVCTSSLYMTYLLGRIVDAIIVLNHRRQLTTHMYVKHPHRTYQWMAEYAILTSVFRIRNRKLYVCAPAHITIRFLYMIPILIVIVAWTFKQNGDLV